MFWWAVDARDLAVARGLTFTTLVVGILLRAFSVRSRKPLWSRALPRNPWLGVTVAASIALQLGIFLIPTVREWMHVGTPDWADLGIAVGVGVVPVVVSELWKVARGGRN